MSTRTVRSDLLWEAVWIPAEIAACIPGLYLGLARDDWSTGGAWLFGVVVLSGAVRLWHYTQRGIAPQVSSKPRQESAR
jgi:hypothetical protein